MSRPRLIDPHRLRPRQADGGFALLITITLLAFLVLLLVSLASLTRVETHVAANSRHLATARQHALFGLNVALGRLQETAGPDQRVTATADLVPLRDPSKQHWTGVWDSDPQSPAYGNHLAWLVSGVSGDESDVRDPLAAADGNTVVELVGANTVDASDSGAVVRVETQPITSTVAPGLADDTGGHRLGAFAYWVGDEGVKANVSLVNPWAASPSADERHHGFVAAQRAGIELVQANGSATLEDAWPADAPGIARMVALDQLPLLSASPVLAEARRNRFHDLTAHSFSLPSDVARGGLKKDLTNWIVSGSAPAGAVEQDSAPVISTPEGAEHGLPRWGLLRSYASLNDTGAPVPPGPHTDGRHGLYPVVTYFRLGVGVSCEGPDRPLRIHLFPTLALWNPHNVPIAHVDPATGDPVRYELAFSVRGASSRLRFRVGGPEGAEKALLSLNKASLGDAGSANRYFRFEVAPTAPIPPGQSLVFTLADDGEYSPGRNVLVNAADTGASAVMLGDVLSAADIAAGVNRSTLTGNTMDVVLRMKPPESDPDPVNYDLLPHALQTVQRIGFGNLNTNQLIRPVPGFPPLTPNVQFHLFASMSTSGMHRVRWLAQQNYRAPFSPRPAIDGTAYHSIYFGAVAVDPSAPNFAEGGARASAGTAVQDSNANDLVLVEFQPRNAPLFSLAQLQHANLSLVSHYPGYAVGNSLAPPFLPLDATSVSPGANAGEFTRFHDVSYLLNRELWDRYFFSTVPASLDAGDLADPDFHLPNARHVVRRSAGAPEVDALRGVNAFDTAAAHLLVNGGFNVNSTSVQAWRAHLASHLGQAVDPADPAKRHPFSRFAHPTTEDVNRPWEGYRVLSDRQIERLAFHVVEEVRKRGPFLSLADFVNRRLQARGASPDDGQRFKGALQAAIDATDTESGPAAAPINTFAAFNTDLVPTSTASGEYYQEQFQGGPTRRAPYSSRSAFAPGYLTQADLLTALGPVLAARSDTFRIRAYGETRNPVTGAIEGKAWCEAVVQRQPEFVDSAVPAWTTPASGSDARRFGRRFRIIFFRWLNPDDI